MWGRIPTALASPVRVTHAALRTHPASLPLTLETNRLARLAPASAVLSTPTTTILATVAEAASTSSSSSAGRLVVDFRSKAASVGVIPSTFTRREHQPALFETLVARLVDRSVRPCLPPSAPALQLSLSVLAAPRVPDAPLDALAANAAFAALSITPALPHVPLAAARVALHNNSVVPFPSEAHLQQADLSVYVAVNPNAQILALSLHTRHHPVPESDVLHAIAAAVDAATPLLPTIHSFRDRVHDYRRSHGLSAFPPQPPPSPTPSPSPLPPSEIDAVYTAARQSYEAAFVECRRYPGKAHRANVLTTVQHQLIAAHPRIPSDLLQPILNHAARDAHAAVLRRDRLRIDGRPLHAVRPVRCDTAVLPGDVHGSALFERGDTQVLACTTIGHRKQIRRTEEYVDGNDAAASSGFFVHYSFPPFATGEHGRFAGALNRREVGHSILTERSIGPLLGGSDIALDDGFPYALRLSADVLSSDGSSSMASVCAGSLALMDAGAPLREPVAGIAMGLVPTDGEADVDGDDIILTDILGAEDHFGDMDLKVSGTASGITACQLDVKRKEGVSVALLGKVLERAREGRAFILNRMEASAGLASRREMAECAPRLVRVAVDRQRARNTLFRDRFRGLRAIGEKTMCYLKASADGDEIVIEAPNKKAAQVARRLVEDATREVCVGDVLDMTVIETNKTYAVMEAVCGCISGIAHVSKIRVRAKKEEASADGPRRTSGYPDARDLLSVGEDVTVGVLEADGASSSTRFQVLSRSSESAADELASEIDSILSASRS